jgi:RNA polymerase sigma factor (sigma-70 family)
MGAGFGKPGATMNQAPITRPSLLVRLREPANHAAWAEFVNLYTPLVHGFCRQRGLQEADAADVAQEVLMAVARTMKRFEYQPSKGTFRSWLFTVTRNKFNNFLAKRRRQPLGSGDTVVQQFIEAQPCPETEAAWDRQYHQRLFDWACQQVRREFQETTWQAFWRTAVEDHPGHAVAQGLGLSVGAVYIAKSRVLARLREKTQEVAGDTALRGV